MKDYKYKVEKIFKKINSINGIEKIILVSEEGYPVMINGKWRSRMRIVYYTVNIISIFNIANSIQKEQTNMIIIEGGKSKVIISSIRPDERFMKKQLKAAQALNEKMQNFFLIILTAPDINLIHLLMSLGAHKKTINSKIEKEKSPFLTPNVKVVNGKKTELMQNYIQFDKKLINNNDLLSCLPEKSIHSICNFLRVLSTSIKDLYYAFISMQKGAVISFALQNKIIDERYIKNVSSTINSLLKILIEICSLKKGNRIKNLIIIHENSYLFSYLVSGFLLTIEIENRGKLKEVQYLDHFTTLLPYYLIKLNSTLEGNLIGFELKPL